MRHLPEVNRVFHARPRAPGRRLPPRGAWKPGSLPPAAPVPIVMQLDWKANVQFAGLLLAKERGWYADAGLDVRIQPADSADILVVQSVLTEPNTIGSSESSALLEARGKGAKIKAVATMFQGSPMALLSLEKSGISEMRDLVGKRIGMHTDGRRVLDVAFADAGIPSPPTS